jgi:hypothetical protein
MMRRIPGTDRYRCTDEPSRAIRAHEEIKQAELALASAEKAFEPYAQQFIEPGSNAEKLQKAVEEARAHYEELRFAFVDHALPLSVRLHALNHRNAEFWRQR